MRMRAATPDEFEEIRAFYWNLIDHMKDQSNTIGWKKGIYPTDAFLQESLERQELYVLTSDKEYIAAVIVNSAWNEGYEGLPWSIECEPGDVLVPHALAVHPLMQGQGIGRQVVADVLELAAMKGKKTVRLDLLAGNRAAETLYTSMGFRFVQEKIMFYEDTGWTEYRMYERNLT